VIGVNFGRVGFLAAMSPNGMEDGLRRVFQGERQVIELRRSTSTWTVPTESG
jgi:NAD kinase